MATPSQSPPERSTHRRRGVLVAALAAVLVVAALLAVLLPGRGGPDDRAAAPSGPSVSVLTTGAVGDGRTDDTAAVQQAFDRARPGETVLLPAGRTFAVSKVLTLSTPRVTVSGGGTLLSTDEQHSSLTLAADGITLSDVTLSVARTTRRWDAYEQQRLRLDGHTGITVRKVTITGSAAAGVYVGGGTSHFLLDHVTVRDTRADGIHITQGSHDGKVVSPVVRDVGDDGVAVVSYAQDGAPCARITVSDPTVDGSTGGRGVSVVGGTDVTYTGIDVRRTYAAAVYVAAEGSFGSTGVDGVRIAGGTVRDANVGTDIDHGAVLVYNGTDGQSVSDVDISGLTITGTRASASRWVGLVDDGAGRIDGVRLTRLALDGAGPGTTFVTSEPGIGYTLSGWTRDGKELAGRTGQAAAGSSPAASSPAATTSGAGATTSAGQPTAAGAAAPRLDGGATTGGTAPRSTAAGTPGTAGTLATAGTPAADGDDAPLTALVPSGATQSLVLPGTVSGPVVSVLTAGAVGDGRTDDTAALQRAFDQAKAGSTVLLPAGRTFVQSGVLTIRTPGITVTGGGTLLATDEQRSSLTVSADRVLLSDVTLRVASTTKRWSAYEQQRLRLDGHTGITVRRVTVTGSAAAGVYVGGGSSGFLLDHVTVTGTRADGIHLTQGSHDGKVVSPVVRSVGDDGVAVVSYAQDGAPCARITVTGPLVDGSSGGRGITVVGGTDVTYSDVDVRNTYAAGVYVAAEGGWMSTGVDGVQITRGTVRGANLGTGIDHGAVLVYDGTPDRAVRGVTVSGLALSGLRSSASRWVGLVADSTGPVQGAVLSGISITGPGPGTLFVSNAATTTYRLTGWRRDGAAVPDRSQG